MGPIYTVNVLLQCRRGCLYIKTEHRRVSITHICKDYCCALLLISTHLIAIDWLTFCNVSSSSYCVTLYLTMIYVAASYIQLIQEPTSAWYIHWISKNMTGADKTGFIYAKYRGFAVT